MNIKAKKFLRDVQRAAELVARFAAGKSPEDYNSDALLRSAVERQMGIIGEALNQALRLEPAIQDDIRDSRRIVAFRNILVHTYWMVNDATVWEAVERHLLSLQEDVTRLLQRPDSEVS